MDALAQAARDQIGPGIVVVGVKARPIHAGAPRGGLAERARSEIRRLRNVGKARAACAHG